MKRSWDSFDPADAALLDEDGLKCDSLPNGMVLYQDESCFKLGQDSVLLAYFARIGKWDRVLDLGCGAGVLTLLSYAPGRRMTGLELQPRPFALFCKNLVENDLHERIHAIHGDLRQAQQIFQRPGCFDYVICNPPYFKTESGKTAANDSLARARSDETASIAEVAAAAGFCLRNGGRLGLVFRPERLLPLLDVLRMQQLTPKRLRFVHQRADRNPSAVLVECRKGSKEEGLRVEPPFLVKDQTGNDTDEYKKLYHWMERKDKESDILRHALY